MALNAGTRLGPYEILAAIGAGGMGEVYRARDTRLKRDVAIKVLPDAFANDPERLARFQREAELLATLNHPNIAQIHGVEDRALVLELVEGPTLADRIAQGRIPIDEALAIAKQIAEALEAAHEHGIIHRDLKPANIKLTPDGKVKVLDFGLAKLGQTDHTGSVRLQADLSMSPTITSPAMTLGGVILGTAAYMSPEQARGKPVDKRSDIWAFGCVTYEMLTSRGAFDANETTDVLARILEREPDWSVLPALTPSPIRRLLRRALEKDVRRRMPDIGSARLEIDDALAQPVGELPVPARRWFMSPAIAYGLTGVTLALAAFMGLSGIGTEQSTDAPVYRFDIAPPDTMEFPVSTNINQHWLAVSPDGTQIAFTVYATADFGPRRSQLFVRPLNSSQARPVSDTQGAISPFWSPNSRSIAFFSGGALKRVDAAGGPVTYLASAAPSGVDLHGSWGSRDVIVFTGNASRSELRKVAAGGGDAATIIKQDGTSFDAVSFLPDGEHFLYRSRIASEAGHIFVGNLDGRESRQLVSTDSQAQYASGHLLFTRGTTLVAQPFSAADFSLGNQPIPILNDVGISTSGTASFSVSNNGVLLFQEGTGLMSRLAWVGRNGKLLEQVGEPAIYSNLRLSPDSTKLAVCIADPRLRTRDIWIIDLVRGTREKLTTNAADDLVPVWSPDVATILFASDRLGPRDLYRKSIGGFAEEQPVLATSSNKHPTDWSPDGRFALFHGGPGEGISVLDVNTATARPWRPSRSTESEAQYSPDGEWIAYQSTESGRSEVYVAPVTGSAGKQLVSAEGGAFPRWRRDGKEIFYLVGLRRLMAAQVIRSSGGGLRLGAPLEVLAIAPALTPGKAFDVSPDGQRFLISQQLSESNSAISVIVNWPAQIPDP